MIKSLIRHGNSRALIIDKALLLAAGLNEDTALFQITLDPNGGILIQSIKGVEDSLHRQAFEEIISENQELMKRLSQR